ncbi:molybdopterin-dependent oxidoreductase [Edwardsiella anguillarum]|nr:molybdopterin-dependent oxidoreductase [Edwardsiella anguillarum]
MHVPLKNGSNIAFLNAMAQVIIAENLHDRAFIEQHTEEFDTFRELVAAYTPESVEETTGISAQMIRETARMYAKAPSATILWGMGLPSSIRGGDRTYPDQHRTVDRQPGQAPRRRRPGARAEQRTGRLRYGRATQHPPRLSVRESAGRTGEVCPGLGVEKLNDKIGYALSEVPHNIDHGLIKAHYVMGEDPLQTEPDLATIRRTFEQLDLLIVQDIFMTKTAAIADVIFPATSWGEHEGVYTSADRGFQRFYKAVEPVGDVKRDWEIIGLMSTAMGYPMRYSDTRRFGTSCVSCARSTTAPPMRRWRIWPISSGRARRWKAPAPSTCTRAASSTRPMAKASSLPANGARRSIASATTIRWCWRRFAKWAITPVAP